MEHRALSDNLARVRDRIATRQRAGGWSHPVRIVAVTKGHPIEAVAAAAAAGLTDVGENRVQEALAKLDRWTGPPLAWHLIGSLQRNKARHAVGRFALIHSVDRSELAAELGRRCPEGERQRVLIEVNCSGEPAKSGVEPEGLIDLVKAVVAEPRLEFDGLMTMAAQSEDESVQRAAFGRLRRLKEDIERSGTPVADLSMGMSGDFEAAVEEGATIIRLGTLLFGERMR